MARWYLRLAPFLPNLTLEHKPGTANQPADALSRLPKSQDRVLQIEVDVVGSTMNRIQASQKEDSEVLQLIEYLDHQALLQDPITAKKIVTQALKG